MDNPILTPQSGGCKKVLEFITPEVFEAERKRGIGVMELRHEIDEFLRELAIARKWYQDPALRPFLDLPDEVVEVETSRLKQTAEDLRLQFVDFIQRWTKLEKRRRESRRPKTGDFLGPKPGGVA